MPGFPLTAWALRHPLGSDEGAVLDGLRNAGSPTAEPVAAMDIAGALLDELARPCREACARWGTSRVAVVLGSAAPTTDHPLDRLRAMLALIRQRTGIAGPLYHVAATGAGGAKALASADRLLRASLADAVLVGGIDDGLGALLLVERHGDAFVELRASAEATSAPDAEPGDEDTTRRVLLAVWSAGARSPLGYVHVHAPPGHTIAEERVLASLFGPTPHCTTPMSTSSTGAAAGAIDAVLAAASLRRGYTPEAMPRELEHDRVLLHAFSPGGHHVGLLLEARA